MNTVRLRPCPWGCKGQPKEARSDHTDGRVGYFVMCFECFCRGPVVTMPPIEASHDAFYMAAKLWNGDPVKLGHFVLRDINADSK